jgi:hypothetical protein
VISQPRWMTSPTRTLQGLTPLPSQFLNYRLPRHLSSDHPICFSRFIWGNWGNDTNYLFWDDDAAAYICGCGAEVAHGWMTLRCEVVGTDKELTQNLIIRMDACMQLAMLYPVPTPYSNNTHYDCRKNSRFHGHRNPIASPTSLF